jgi:hypothetical protein
MEITRDSVLVRLGAIEAAVASVGREQRNITAALQLMLESIAHQTELLTRLADLAKEEPETSQLSNTLNRLTRAVLALEMVSQRLDKLPQKIGEELDKQFGAAPAPTEGRG